MQEPPVSKSGPNRQPVRLTPMPVPKASDVLADDLRERILLGEFPEGTALPTERTGAIAAAVCRSRPGPCSAHAAPRAIGHSTTWVSPRPVP